MPVQTFEQEWRSGNKETAYPFTDQTRPEQIPSDFLIDLQVGFAGRTELDAKLAEIAYDSVNDTYTLTVRLNDALDVFGSVAIPRIVSGQSREGKKVVVTEGGYILVAQPGPKWHDPTWGGAGDWTLTPTGGNTIQPSQVARQPQTFLRIFIDGETIPPENEWPRGVFQKLQAGYNLEFTDRPNEFVPTALPSRINEDIWHLQGVPGGGLGYPETSEAIDYVAKFDNQGPDSAGNVTWNGIDCIRVSIPDVDGAPIPNTIQIASDCGPCCPCGEYRNLSRAIGRRSAKIKDYCDIIAATLQEAKVVYDEGVAIVNSKRPPMVLVRNVRAVGSHLLFTVSNVSETPIYAYVAMDIISHTGLSPLPFTAANTPTATVQTVDQTTEPTIDLVIDAHRLTLPFLDFHSLENPLATFPSATFAPLTVAHILVAVGGVSKSAAFPPIPPGQTVEVSLFSPSVEAEILALLAGPSSYDTDAEREAIVSKTLGAKKPQIRFRSTAVFGTSHAYPCAGETYEVKVEEFEDDDIMRQVCDTNLERRFQAVEVNVRKQVGGRPS